MYIYFVKCFLFLLGIICLFSPIIYIYFRIKYVKELYRKQFRNEIKKQEKYKQDYNEWQLSDKTKNPPFPPFHNTRILVEGYEYLWGEVAKEFES